MFIDYNLNKIFTLIMYNNYFLFEIFRRKGSVPGKCLQDNKTMNCFVVL